MFGHTIWMELRTGWKGLFVISILVFITTNGMVQIYPTFQDSLTEDLEGADKVDLIIPEEENDDLIITWEPLENADMYFVLESDSSALLINSSVLIYMGNLTNITTFYNTTETKYYAVMALVNSSFLPVLVGIDSQGEGILIFHR
jgi:hypothetical protein